MKNMRVCLKAILFIVFSIFIINTAAASANTRVDLVLDGGSVLIYKGKEAGFKEGQKLDVIRGDTVVGTLEVTKVTNAFVQAKILSGAREIQELDAVVAATGETKADKPTKEPKETKETKKSEKKEVKKEEESTDEAAGEKKETKTTSRRRSSRAESEEAESAEPAKEEESSSAKSKRSSRSSSSKTEEAPEEKTEEPASGSSGSSRRGRSSRGSSGSEESGETEETSGSGTVAPAPKVLGKKPYASIHVGYFYLQDDVPGNVTSREPSKMFGIDYWQPWKNKEDEYLVYSFLYSRPTVTTTYANQQYRYQLKFTELSVNYIWDGLDRFVGRGSSMYAGLGVGYRSATSRIEASVSYTGTADDEKKSQAGLDYHGIIGAKFRKKMDFKLNYCFDEKYYTIDLGYKY